MTYDAIVLGLGGMGSATLSALARRGLKTLGIEQFPLVHTRGSSHGHTRIIRTAYAEHPSYVPLVKRAFTLWRELEQRRSLRLLNPHPCLNIGPPTGEHIRGVLESVKLHNLQSETLNSREIARRFPAFRLPDDYCGVLERDAGYLFVEECVRAHLHDALATGNAEVRSEEPVIAYDEVYDQIRVTTEKDTYFGKQLVIAGGAWATRLLKDLNLPLNVMRQVQLWFQPENEATFQPHQFPLYIVETPSGDYYGFPQIDGRGMKCARHHGASLLNAPEDVDWSVHDTDESPVRGFMRNYFSAPIGKRTDAMVCMYTVTPDRHFIIERHPRSQRIHYATGFSGHGFKFAPTVGEILADLVTSGKTSHDIRLFSSARFQ